MVEAAKMPVLFIAHGGGPLPLMGDAHHRGMVDALEKLRGKLPKPRAILMFSAHWEAEQVQITGGKKPDLIYDYYGFPEAAYHLQYPAEGKPALAEELRNVFEAGGIKASIDPDRGFDHGMFVPLKLLFPEADIPVVQVSLLKNMEPSAHIQLGKLVAHLRSKGMMIIGSGMTFHNMRALRQGGRDENLQKNGDFHGWLDDVLIAPEMTEDGRAKELEHWLKAPHARYCHPREEHLLPVHVCYGAAEAPVDETIKFDIFGYETRCYLWG